METYERIRQRRLELGLSADDVAEALNISRATVYRYESNDIEKLPVTIIKPLSEVLKCDVSYLMGWDEPVNKNKRVINVLGRVAAGIPIDAIEEIIDTEEISDEMARTGEFFGLLIQGDSMEPDIHNGDIVIVRKQDDAETDEIVIAIVNGDDGVCKRLKKYADSIALVSNNPSYAPIYFNKDEIDTKPVRIIGKVVELRRKF